MLVKCTSKGTINGLTEGKIYTVDRGATPNTNALGSYRIINDFGSMMWCNMSHFQIVGKSIRKPESVYDYEKRRVMVLVDAICNYIKEDHDDYGELEDWIEELRDRTWNMKLAKED